MLLRSEVSRGALIRAAAVLRATRVRSLSSSWPRRTGGGSGLQPRTLGLAAFAHHSRRSQPAVQYFPPSLMQRVAWLSTDSTGSTSATGAGQTGSPTPPMFTPNRQGRASTDEPDVLHDGPVELMHKTSGHAATVRDADGNVIVLSGSTDEAYEMAGGGGEALSEEENEQRRAMAQKRANDMDDERDDWARHAQSEVELRRVMGDEDMGVTAAAAASLSLSVLAPHLGALPGDGVVGVAVSLQVLEKMEGKSTGVAEDARLEEYLRREAGPAMGSPIFPGDNEAHPAAEQTANHHKDGGGGGMQAAAAGVGGADTRVERGSGGPGSRRRLPPSMADLKAQLATAGYGSMSPRESGRAFGEPFWEGGSKPKVPLEELGQQGLDPTYPETRKKLEEDEHQRPKPVVRAEAAEAKEEEQRKAEGQQHGGKVHRVDVKTAMAEATARAVKETTEGVASTVVTVSEGVSAAVDLAKDAVTKGKVESPAHDPDQMAKLKQVVGGVKEVADKTGLPTGLGVVVDAMDRTIEAAKDQQQQQQQQDSSKKKGGAGGAARPSAQKQAQSKQSSSSQQQQEGSAERDQQQGAKGGGQKRGQQKSDGGGRGGRRSGSSGKKGKQ